MNSINIGLTERVADVQMLCNEFVLGGDSEGASAEAPGGAGGATYHTVEMLVERTSVAVAVVLQGSTSLGSDHWSRTGQLQAPPSVPLRVLHTRTRGFACELSTDARGEALIDHSHGLYVNESYTIEVRHAARRAKPA